MGFFDDFFWFLGNDEKKKRKREKKRRKEAERAFEEERQRRIELENQLKRQKEEEEKQRQIDPEKQTAESKRSEISVLAKSFEDESLREWTLERVENAGHDKGKLHIINEEARCARTIETEAKSLPTPYRERIMQELLNAYQDGNDLEEVQEFQRLIEQDIQTVEAEKNKISMLAKSFENESLREWTLERLENACNREELYNIKEGMGYAQTIELKVKSLPVFYHEIFMQKLLDAYRYPDLVELQAILKEIELGSKISVLAKSFENEFLREWTLERLENAGYNKGKLHIINEEARCARTIESEAKSLPTPYRERIIQELLNAYQYHDFVELQAIQREIELEKQEEDQGQIERERQRQIELEKQRQQEKEGKRQAISAFIEFFASKSLQELTREKLKNAGDDWKKLCITEKEARYARNIESNANILPKSPYYEAIMQRLFDAYSAHDTEELQALLEESEQFRDLKIIKSCLLSGSLRQLTNERIANADTIEDLRRIAKEVLCVDTIQQCYKELGWQGYQKVYRKLEGAYRNRDFDTLQVLVKESKQVQDLLQSIKTCPLSTNLREITDERVANAGGNMDELRKIEKEALCARTFEQCYQYLVMFGHTYIELEDAYRKRDFDTLLALRAKAIQLKSSQEKLKRISPREDDGISVVFGD